MKYSRTSPQERVRLLESTLIFNSLDRSVLENLAARLQEAAYGPGQVVVAEGEQADSLFIIVEGKAEISVGSAADESILASVAEGELFGEMAFFAEDQKRQATVTAIGELHVLVLDGAVFRQLVTNRPELSRSVKEIAEGRTKVNFIKRFSPFKSLPPHKIKMLVSQLEKMTVAPGTMVMRQGETGQECYLIISGKMEVLMRESGQPERRIATLYPGSVLGEAALLTEGPRNATVRALESCELLVIRRNALLDIMREHNQFNSQLLATLQQRDRPSRIENVEVQQQCTADRQAVRVLKNPERGTYVRLSSEAWFIWERLDGQHTLKDLTIEFIGEMEELAPEKIADIISELAGAGFIKSRTLRSDVRLLVSKVPLWQRLQMIARGIMEWNLVWKNPDPMFSLVYRLLGALIFSRAVQVLFGAVSVSGFVVFILLAGRVSPFLNDTSQSRGVLLFLVPAVIVPLVLHELGHALTTKHYGKEVRYAGVGWYWFGPVAFVDTSDIWTADEWPRIAVSLAGSYAQVIFAGIVSYVAWFSSSPVVAASLWQYVLLSHIGVLMNFNPLLEYDGYYVLSDLVNRPNLRRRSLEWLGKFAKGDVDRLPELRSHRLEFFYSISCLVFTPLMAYAFVATYRILLEVHLKTFLPAVLASGIPWLITLIIFVAAGIIVLGEMKVFQRHRGK